MTGKGKNFVLIGAAGYVAPRHMEAIRACGGNLIAALDPHESVGVLDSYFPECAFFTEFERFDRFCSKERDNGNRIHYVSICSPNYLHDAHIRFALRLGADAICEKPMCLTERNLDELAVMEERTGRRVWTILQLRLNPDARAIKEKAGDGRRQVDIVYHTPRGKWYGYTWKGDEKKSGGIAANIGIHLFDFMVWAFGPPRYMIRQEQDAFGVWGGARCERADVSFDLSVRSDYQPCRRVLVDGDSLDLSRGFETAHIRSYAEILAGRGFGIEEARAGIKVCEELRREP